MNEEQRDGIRILASLMEEVHLNGAESLDVDISFKMRQPVQALFEGSPAEVLLPILGDAFDIINCHAVFPSVAVNRIREFGQGELLIELVHGSS